jgi:hypothetical protein
MILKFIILITYATGSGTGSYEHLYSWEIELAATQEECEEIGKAIDDANSSKNSVIDVVDYFCVAAQKASLRY